jgi:hypothetical protein
MLGWFGCLWTTAWASNTATVAGGIGLAIGAAIGIALMFLPALRFPDNSSLDRGVGKAVVMVCTFAGLLAGELTRVAWSGVCY